VPSKIIRSVNEFISAVQEDSATWHVKEPKWFRGEPEYSNKKALLPTLYRSPVLGRRENELLQMFRARAQGYHREVPNRDNTDQWLYLARHAGLPTRLLDWSEGALLGLHFSLQHKRPVVWMLNPLELNDLSLTVPLGMNPKKPREFSLPWAEPKGGKNPVKENICGAWEHDQKGVDLPVAVYPTYVHPRLRGQRACFTIHGKLKKGLAAQMRGEFLKRYVIAPASRQSMIRELEILGVTHSVAFPDLDGLAKELIQRFS
jgi:hypothetical protein